MKEYIKKCINYGGYILSIYIFWSVVHYLAFYLYKLYCVPDSMFGYLFSPVLIHSPHCKGLIWMINASFNSLNHMIGLLISLILINLQKIEKPK